MGGDPLDGLSDGGEGRGDGGEGSEGSEGSGSASAGAILSGQPGAAAGESSGQAAAAAAGGADGGDGAGGQGLGAALALTRADGFQVPVFGDQGADGEAGSGVTETTLFINKGVTDQSLSLDSVEREIRFAIPNDAFGHADRDAVITLTATGADGAPLPAWLDFNSRTGEFRGQVPPGSEGDLEVRVVATDNLGNRVEVEFRVQVKPGSEVVSFRGKPTFGEQLREQSALQWKQERDQLLRLAHELRQLRRAG